MKYFLRILGSFFTIASVLLLVINTGCKDKCGTTTCQNGGTCSNNTCVCPKGYSGNSCQTSWSTQFIGTYNCTRSCNPAIAGSNTWQSAVTRDATNGGYTIDISNFNSTTSTQVATVDSAGNLYIAPAAGSSGVSGSGIYRSTGNGVITLDFTTYAVGGGSGEYHCTITMTKE